MTWDGGPRSLAAVRGVARAAAELPVQQPLLPASGSD